MNDTALSTDPRLPGDCTEHHIEQRFGSPRLVSHVGDIEPPERSIHDAPRRNHLAVAVEELLSTRHRLTPLADKYVSMLGDILSDFAADMIHRHETNAGFECGTMELLAGRIVDETRKMRVAQQLAPKVAPTLGTITGETMESHRADIEDPYSGEPGDVQARRDV